MKKNNNPQNTQLPYGMLEGMPAGVRDEGYETIWMGGATSSYATPKEELL
jgi:hypothetical protein